MASSKNYSAEVVLTMNAKQAKQELNGLRSKLDEVEHAMDGMRAAGKQNTDEFKKMAKEQKQFKSAVSQLEGQLITVEQVMSNLGRVSLNQMEKAYRALTQRVKNNTQATAELREQMSQDIASMRKLEKEIAKTSGMWKTHEGAINSVIKRLAAYVSVYGAFNLIKGKVTDLVKANISFSDTLADIRKTTGLAVADVNELSDAINKIDTRTSREELHQLAFEAGRMGLGKYGTEGVLSFVKAADQLKVALGEDLGDDAIIQLTKMTDVMGLIPKYGVEQSLLKVGSAINELAQNSTAKGTYITNFASRLSGVSRQCNLTTADLFGLAAASDALSLETEVAATAMSKFLVQMQYKPQVVAQAAGIEEEALRSLLEVGKTGEAVLMVLEGLGNKGGMAKLAPVMKSLGSDGARMINIFSTLASNVDKVRENMDIAAASFEEGISVTDEFNIKNNTAAAIMERTGNAWKTVAVNFKNASIAKDLANAIKDVSDELLRSKTILNTIRIVLKSLVAVLNVFVKLLPALTFFGILKGAQLLLGVIMRSVTGFGAFGASVGKAAVALGMMTKEQYLAARATKTMKTEQDKLNASMKANIFLAIASVIMSILIPAMKTLVEYTRDVKGNFKDIDKSVGDARAEMMSSGDKVHKQFNELEKAMKESPGSNEHKRLLMVINNEYGDYLGYQLTEQTRLADLEVAHAKVNDQLQKSIAYRLREKMLTDEQNKGYSDQAAAMIALQERLEKQGLNGEQIEQVLQSVKKNAPELGDQTVFKRMMGGRSGTANAAAAYINEMGGSVATGFRKQLQDALGVSAVASLFNLGGEGIMKAIEEYAHSVITTNKRTAMIERLMDELVGDYIPDIEGGGINKPGGDEAADEKIGKAKKQYEAFMALLEAYYARKKALYREDYVNGNMTDEQLTEAEEQNDRKRLEALKAAGEAILGREGSASAWNNIVAGMLNDAQMTDDQLYDIAEMVLSKDMGTFGAFLRQFGSTMTDGINKSVETYGAEIQGIDVEVQKAIEKALLERDLTGKVRQEYGGSMQRLGLLSYLIPDGKTAKEAMNDVLEQMLSVYDRGALFEITEKDAGKAMKEILASFTGISDEMRNMDDTRLRLLLDYMIRFGNATDEARKKMETMRHNVLFQNWDRGLNQSLSQRARNDERRGTFVGQLSGLIGGNNVAQSQSVIAAEHEVDAIAKKIVWLRAQGDAEAELIKLTDELEAAENKLTQALIENVKDQADVIRELGGVLETAADEWGEYLGTTYETEEDSVNARREIWNSMVDSAGGAIEKILKQWVTETITTAMLNQAKLEQQRQANTQMESEQARHTATMISTEATELTAIGAAETGKAGAKAIGTYGLKGVAIAALASAIIGGFIKFAMAKLKKPAIETSSKIATNAANRRLVSTMLTYDAGNVQALGSDGHIYSATPVGALQTGLYTSPVATTVNGQPALVAEKGPEFVIGRETTAAIQRNDPALLRAMMVYDRHYSGRGLRTFDAGNVGSMDIAYGGATEAQLAAAVAQLNAILARGIKADINMYGESGLRNRLRQADKFMQGK